MKTLVFLLTVTGILFAAGCGTDLDSKTFLSVNFQEDQTLRYKFVSKRDIKVNWEPAKQDLGRTVKSSESMELVVAYTPVEIDSYGLIKIEAVCESVKVKRISSKKRQSKKRDAVTTLKGKRFTFSIDATGKIRDYSQLEQLIQETAQNAFRSGGDKGKIKDPDMIDDFIASQWFLWDSVSSREQAVEGIAVGQSWESKLTVPNPLVIRKARNVTYTLSEIRQSEKGRLAVINSTFSPAESFESDWPNPYIKVGKFMVSGEYGFLRNYKVIDLQGQGQELFNIDEERTEEYNHEYKMQVETTLPLGMGINPLVTINQSLDMQLLGD